MPRSSVLPGGCGPTRVHPASVLLRIAVILGLCLALPTAEPPTRGTDRLEQALGLLRLADKDRLDTAALDAAAAMLGDEDLFVQGVAEWAIATKVGHDNNTEDVVWPMAGPPAWFGVFPGIGRGFLRSPTHALEHLLPAGRGAELSWLPRDPFHLAGGVQRRQGRRHAGTPPRTAVLGADRALGYEWLIQPILDQRCMPCHNGTDQRTTCNLTARKVKTAERELNQSYISLLGGNLHGDGKGNGKDSFLWICNRFSDGSVSKPYEFGSTRSRLVQILKKGHHDVRLTPDEWLRLVTWVDANGIYHDRFIDKRPPDGGTSRRDAEFRWADPFNPTGDFPWQRIDGLARAGAPAVQGHAFVATDPRLNKVVMVDATGQVTWEYPSDTAVDVAVLANGNLLVSNHHGAQEVDRGKRVVWEYHAPTDSEVFSCQPLPDGSVLVCECGSKRLLEIDRDGKVVKEIPLESGKDRHNQFRIARKTAAGTYLVACHGDNLVQELDGAGRRLRTIRTPGNAFLAERLPDGNTLIACGDGHRLVEVDTQDRVVWELAEHDLPGNPLRFVGGFQRLANGHLLLCNWPCHGFEGQQPLLVEVTRDKRVVWQWSSTDLRGIAHLALLPAR